MLLGGGMVSLVVGADRAINAAVKLAKALGMSTIIIGATVVSLGTTAPEACVSVMAAVRGNPGLAMGNSVGSIICNLALIFGLCCAVKGLPLDRYVLLRHGRLHLAAGLLLAGIVGALALRDGGIDAVVLPRWVGVVFLGLLAAYMLISLFWARKHPEMVAQAESPAAVGAGAAILGLVVLAVGIALVVLGADVMIGSVLELCTRYGVPDHVLAVTVVALGTSLPELATGLASVIKGHPELLVGNVLGANILNVLFVIGAAATATPLEVPPDFFYLHLPVMLGAMV
ncbi:MAG: sodium:calcium antiporter, partial [Planctomycetota bacterium]